MNFIKVGNDWVNLEAITRVREIPRKDGQLPQLMVFFTDRQTASDVTDSKEIETILTFLDRHNAAKGGLPASPKANFKTDLKTDAKTAAA